MSIRARGGLIIECIFVSTGGWPETRGWSGGGGGGVQTVAYGFVLQQLLNS